MYLLIYVLFVFASKYICFCIYVNLRSSHNDLYQLCVCCLPVFNAGLDVEFLGLLAEVWTATTGGI